MIELDGLAGAAPETSLRTCFELGHALGNQHWPAVVKGPRVYVPLTVDRKVMASVMRTHAFEGITYEFVPGAEVIPYLAPHEARRLFGGADGPCTRTRHERYVAIDADTGRAHRHHRRRVSADADATASDRRRARRGSLQFGDSTLPVGAFSFSNGLESAVQQRVVARRGRLREFVAHRASSRRRAATASRCSPRIAPPWTATSSERRARSTSAVFDASSTRRCAR